MFRLVTHLNPRASRVCDAPVYLTISKTNKDKHSNAPPTVRPKGQVAVAKTLLADTLI